MRFPLKTAFEITKLLKHSPKQKSHLKEIIEKNMRENFRCKTIRTFSQARETFRAKCPESIVTSYENLNNFWEWHCVKSVRIWSYSGPYFPAFGLNTLSISTYKSQNN